MFIVIEGANLSMVMEHGVKLLITLLQKDRLDASFLLPCDYFVDKYGGKVHELSEEKLMELDFNEYERRVREQKKSGVRHIISVQYYRFTEDRYIARCDQDVPDMVFYITHSSDRTLGRFVEFVTRQHVKNCVVIDGDGPNPSLEMHSNLLSMMLMQRRQILDLE